MSKTTIYYFSATGNSLAVARLLAKVLDIGDPVSVPGSLVNTDPYLDARDARSIGFVFPVQRATLPEMLRGFIESLPIDPNCYYFAVSTYSLFGCNEFWDIDELLTSKGAALNYAAGVRMMGNVGLKQPSNTTIKRRSDYMKRRVDEIATAVAYHQENFFPRSNKILGKAVSAFTDMRRKNIAFRIDKHCKGCGICVQVCPAQNIQLTKMESGVIAPVRSDKCVACLACIHWCPAAAIRTSSRRHLSYHNPTVLPTELHAPQNITAGTFSDAVLLSKDPNNNDDITSDAELAATLRDDLLTPTDIDHWLREQEPSTKTSRTAPPLPHERAMTDEEIKRALADLEP